MPIIDEGLIEIQGELWSRGKIRKSHQCCNCNRWFQAKVVKMPEHLTVATNFEMFRPVGNAPFRMNRLCVDCGSNKELLRALQDDRHYRWDRKRRKR